MDNDASRNGGDRLKQFLAELYREGFRQSKTRKGETVYERPTGFEVVSFNADGSGCCACIPLHGVLSEPVKIPFADPDEASAAFGVMRWNTIQQFLTAVATGPAELSGDQQS